MKIHYTCVGLVRNDCGIKHRSIGAAARCCHKDHAGIQKSHGGSSYSDRSPVVVEDGIRRALTEEEDDEAYTTL